MNHYEYELVDGTLGELDADNYKKVGMDYVFFKNEKDVYHIPSGWLVKLFSNGEQII